MAIRQLSKPHIYHVLKLAVNILPSFFSFIFLVIMIFACFGFLLFSHTSQYFKSLLDSVMTIFTGLLGRTELKETNLPEADQWKTILFFCLFVIIGVVFLTNLLVAILLDILTIEAQRDCPAVRSDEAQIFVLLWNSFLQAIRIKKLPETNQKEKAQLNKPLDDPWIHPDQNDGSLITLSGVDCYERILNIAMSTPNGIDAQDVVCKISSNKHETD